MEARDASGSIQQVPLGIMTAPFSLIVGLGVTGVIALVCAVFAIRAGGWVGWTLGILAALIAIAGLGFLGYVAWGRAPGYPFGFDVEYWAQFGS